eukprot:TRINITY_DN122861_c0_g1_i1.p1 TRINITY_DN122861_c0_g1~~TRINITY_DN122861_c0_g1_i1.p1  ORF type:complete len:178 (+),score=3.26 TRINITY_DN122861_c0_g1_i1:301-834(+)
MGSDAKSDWEGGLEEEGVSDRSAFLVHNINGIAHQHFCQSACQKNEDKLQAARMRLDMFEPRRDVRRDMIAWTSRAAALLPRVFVSWGAGARLRCNERTLRLFKRAKFGESRHVTIAEINEAWRLHRLYAVWKHMRRPTYSKADPKRRLPVVTSLARPSAAEWIDFLSKPGSRRFLT